MSNTRTTPDLIVPNGLLIGAASSRCCRLSPRRTRVPACLDALARGIPAAPKSIFYIRSSSFRLGLIVFTTAPPIREASARNKSASRRVVNASLSSISLWSSACPSIPSPRSQQWRWPIVAKNCRPIPNIESRRGGILRRGRITVHLSRVVFHYFLLQLAIRNHRAPVHEQ